MNWVSKQEKTTLCQDKMQTEQHIKIGNEFLNGRSYNEAVCAHELNVTKGFWRPQTLSSLCHDYVNHDQNHVLYSLKILTTSQLTNLFTVKQDLLSLLNHLLIIIKWTKLEERVVTQMAFSYPRYATTDTMTKHEWLIRYKYQYKEKFSSMNTSSIDFLHNHCQVMACVCSPTFAQLSYS